MADKDISLTISAQDKTAATFKAVEGKLTSLSAKTAENANKLAGVAAFMGQSAGNLQGIGKAAELAQVGIVSLTGAMSVLGGPAGILLGVVAGISAWALSSQDADAKTYGFAKRVAELKDNMLEVKRIGLQEEFDKTKKEIEEIQEKWRTGPPLFGNRDEYYADQQAIRDGNRVLNELRHQIDATQKQIQAGFTGSKAEGDEARAREQLAKEQERARAKEALEIERAEQQRQREIAQTADRFMRMQEGFYTEEQALAASLANKWTIIYESEQLGLQTDAEIKAARLMAEQEYQQGIEELRQRAEEQEAQHQERLAAISAQGQGAIYSQQAAFLNQLELAQKKQGAESVGIYTNAFAQISAAGAQHSREMFELNKVAGIANAIVSTYQGAAKALDLGWPMGPIAAAMIVANGMAQVSAIQSTSFQGGGKGTTPSAAAAPMINSTPTVPPQIAPASQEPRGITTINVTGNESTTYTQAQLDQLMDAFEEAIERGDRVIISRNSRQAQELMGA